LVETHNWNTKQAIDRNKLSVRMMERMYDCRPFTQVVEPLEPLQSPVWWSAVAARLEGAYDDYEEQVLALASISVAFFAQLEFERVQSVFDTRLELYLVAQTSR
jgi:hypothetical protein